MPDQALIRAIHASGWQCVLAATGGGSAAMSDLLVVPGASQSILETRVPYSQAALVDFLHATPEQFCSERTARAMAMAAFWRARSLAAADFDPQRLIGVGCTASLASDRPKRGAHRAFLALQTSAVTQTLAVEFAKGARSRSEEERLTSDLLLWQLALACGVAAEPPQLLPDERLERHVQNARPEWTGLLLGHAERVGQGAAGAIMPGAFNPLHDGHRAMAAVASRRLGTAVALELSIENVDKPPLDFIEIAARIHQFEAGQPYWLTRAPTFVRKAALFPGATFVVGCDTIARIDQPRYYGDSEAARDRALAAIAAAGCRFLVFGRLEQGRFQTLADLTLHPALRALCDEVPASEFRADISSTELRRQQQQTQQ